MKKRIYAAAAAAALFIALCVVWHSLPVHIPKSAEEKIALYTSGTPNVSLTVGVLSGGDSSVFLYNKDGCFAYDGTEYEIGSVTETFTGALVSKAISEGKISAEDRLSDYIPTDGGAYDPTVGELLTHTSAYGTYGRGTAFGLKYRFGINPFRSVGRDDLIKRINGFETASDSRREYSDLGAAALGAVLEEAYGDTYMRLVSDFAEGELGLYSTGFCLDENADGWSWCEGDVFAASRGLTSNAYDMLAYAGCYFDPGFEYLSAMALPLENTGGGMCWEIAEGKNVIFCNGETSSCSCSVVIDLGHEIAVVALSDRADSRFGDVFDISSALLNEELKDRGFDPAF